MRLVLLGPPGAGKGTQGKRLARHLGVPAISTGDLFRQHRAEGTELGRTVEGFLDRGMLVPDEVTNALVQDRLGDPDVAAGFVLDGYPRNHEQVVTLDQMLEARGRRVDCAVELVVPREVLVERLMHRAEIDGRTDDTPDVIVHRLDVYQSETFPIVDEYGERDFLHHIDGLGTVEEVTDRVLAALAGAGGAAVHGEPLVAQLDPQ